MQRPVDRPPGVTRRRPRSAAGEHRGQGTAPRYGIGVVATCVTAALITLPSAGVALAAADWSAALGAAGLPASAAAAAADGHDEEVSDDLTTGTDEPSAVELRGSRGHRDDDGGR